MAKKKPSKKRNPTRRRKKQAPQYRWGLFVLLIFALVIFGGLAIYFYLGGIPVEETTAVHKSIEPENTPNAPETTADSQGNQKTSTEYKENESVEETTSTNPDLPSYEHEDRYYFMRSFDFGWPAYEGSDLIVEHQGYTLNYDQQRKQPVWVSYKLSPGQIAKSGPEADVNFIEDPLLRVKSASVSDYVGSGFEPASLAPPELFRWSAEAYQECFYLSNVSPQNNIFNSGTWQTMIDQIKTWGIEKAPITVVSGPIFDRRPRKVGKSKIHVPSQFFIVVLAEGEQELHGIGFVLNHTDDEIRLENSQGTIREVEQLAGLDFFPLLPDELEQKVETKVSESWWR